MAVIEVWVMIDCNGDYSAGATDELAQDNYDSEISGNLPRRMVKVVLNVPLPSVPVLTGTVPAEGEAELVSAA